MPKVDTSGIEFPPIIGAVDTNVFGPLRQHVGEGKLGDTAIELSSTSGLGGTTMIVEVTPPGCDTVRVNYELARIVEEVARLITDAPRVDA